ncbi:DUF2127 domain-containing protein [Xylanimonas sp. McL0601]|uniref:DUF2127 domain-containing protein n=1 Tax=Xylanimonas sp. McL0601 TaxID=3414739 RepID=UPI003CEBE9C5
MKERLLDLFFLIGIVVKGIDGLVELLGGLVLLFVSPAQLQHATNTLTAGELRDDPHDVLANLLVHGAAHLGTTDLRFYAAYLLLHGVVKVAIVVALFRGSRKVYPWAIGALMIFLVVQVYELVTAPTAGVLVLTVLDAFIIALTWREWRHGRTLHETWHGTLAWMRGRVAEA